MVSRKFVDIRKDFNTNRTKACEVMDGEFIRTSSVRSAAVLSDAAGDVCVVRGLGAV